MVRSEWQDGIQRFRTELSEARGELGRAEARVESSDETVRDCRVTTECEAEELRFAEDALQESEAEVRALEGQCVEYREMSDAHLALRHQCDLAEESLAHREWVADGAVERELETQTRLVECHRREAELSAECREQARRLAGGRDDLGVLEHALAVVRQAHEEALRTVEALEDRSADE